MGLKCYKYELNELQNNAKKQCCDNFRLDAENKERTQLD